MKTTRYCEEQVRPKRPYIDPAWCAEIIATPIRREEQPDARVRFWGEVTCPGEAAPRVLRVVTPPFRRIAERHDAGRRQPSATADTTAHRSVMVERRSAT